MNSRFVPKIEKPCPLSWSLADATEKQRFCEHCQLHVHNLSAMTESEQQTVLQSRDKGSMCISYVAPANAVTVSSARWVFLQRLPRPAKMAAAAAAAMFSSLMAGCAAPAKPTQAEPPVQSAAANLTPGGKIMAGGICPPPRPLWKRIFGLH